MLQSKDNGVNLFVNVFQEYKLPFDIRDLHDPVDGHIQHRFLGISTIQIGTGFCKDCTFFEIIEFEINEEMVHSEGLPPKKRKQRRILRYDIIFTLDKIMDLSLETHYYHFPQEAVIDCLTHAAPHKVIFSFLPISCACYHTKLEEFAAVCADNCHSKRTMNNMILSNVSNELLQAIKQAVNDFEIMCQNMMELMKLHHEKVKHYKSEVIISSSETFISHSNQSETDWSMSSGDDSLWEKEETIKEELPGNDNEDNHDNDDDYKEKSLATTKSKVKNSTTLNPMKKCLYCGSKSTPMWRRGPQGAGTLCNACGVKWKHGKILNGVSATAPEKKRKRSNSTTKRSKKKPFYDGNEFAVPAPPQPQPQHYHHQHPWESSTTSSSSESPLDSSPNISPSVSIFKRSFYDESIPVYVGEDAVEAAALLTLLKRS